MKKQSISSLFTCLVLLSTQLQSQSYTPFPMADMQWTSKKVIPLFGAPDDDNLYWRIYTVGDTLIDGKNYTSLLHKWECWVRHSMTNNVSYVTQFPNIHYPYDNYLIGAIREEDKRVYFYPYDIEWLSTGGVHGLAPHQDHLLYDFNAVAGDTVHFSPTQWVEQVNGNSVFHTEDHLTLINSVSGTGSFNVSPSDSWSFPAITGSWTEGIGSSFGLFGSYDSFLSFLVCYGPVDQPSCSPCQTAVAVEEADWEARVEVFPNPTGSELVVKNDSGLKMERVRLFDLYGRLLREETGQNAANQFHITLADLPAMVYVLNISFEGNHTLTKKIVKN